MDSSRLTLPNVDRANSTLFKRYLEEQHKSVIKSNTNNNRIPYPLSSTIQITHTYQQQKDDLYGSKLNNRHNQSAIIKPKYSNGRKPLDDILKQRASHTNRFMKRLQRQHKSRDTITNVEKRDGKPRFEFYNPSNSKQTRTNHDTNCTCVTSVDKNSGDHNHDHYSSPKKSLQVPRLSLNERFHSSIQQRRQPIQSAIVQPSSSPKRIRSPLPMLPPTTTKTTLPVESISNLSFPVEQNSPSSPAFEPGITENNDIGTTYFLDPPSASLPDEYGPLINEFLQELSIEMSGKPHVDTLLEIQESLAQRIYDCIIEQDNELENDTQSYTTTINDSSILSAVPQTLSNNIASAEANGVLPSPVSTTATESIDHREKYFRPIREPLPTSFNNLLDRNRHSTPFNPISKQIQNDTRSPFAQSLFEPVNLLRTVATNENDNFDFFPSSFEFETHSNLNKDHAPFLQQDNHSRNELSTTEFNNSVPFLNHLLPPRPIPIDSNVSAFKPIDPANTRAITSFALKRPQVLRSSSSIRTNWFGQS